MMRLDRDEVRRAYWKGLAVGLVVMNIIWAALVVLTWRIVTQ